VLLTVQQGLFVAKTTYAEKNAPYSAGFLWHGKQCATKKCRACYAGVGQVWWTAAVEAAARLYKYADASAKTLLEAHISTVAASKAVDAKIDVPAPEGLAYLPYQKAYVKYAKSRKGILLGDEMGLGKTIQTLGQINYDAEIKSVLIVCPGSLRVNWLREAEKWVTRPFKFHVVEPGVVPPADVDFVIVNYDRLIGDNSELVYAALMSREWDLLVADEAQWLKNPDAQRTIAVCGRVEPKKQRNKETGEYEILPVCPGLVDRAKRKVFLTGTPMLNRPMEVYSLVRALAPMLFPDKAAFRKRYVKNSKYLPELQEKLRANLMVRRLKADVQKELPAKQRQVVVIPPNGASGLIAKEKAAFAAKEAAMIQYKAAMVLAHAVGDKEAYENALAALRDTVQAAFTELAKLRHDLALEKVPYVQDHIAMLREQGVKKIVVFGHHKDVIEQIASKFPDNSVVLTGDVPMDKRQSVVDQFQTDDKIEVFVGGYKVAGLGYTLTASAHVVLAEQDWTPATITQAEDRTHRIGQHFTVLIQHLVFDESLDARMAHYIIEKQKLADKMLDADTSVTDAPIAPVGVAKTADATVAPLPKKYPETSAVEKKLAKQAMQILAGMCDGAAALDDHGFSKVDTKIGTSLASVQGDFTDGQVFIARRLAKIYKKQLPPALLAELGFNKMVKG
jgi:SWI/SNF-related matrix-associated actin-dependent regulator 1 of chromatin subfamily A